LQINDDAIIMIALLRITNYGLHATDYRLRVMHVNMALVDSLTR